MRQGMFLFCPLRTCKQIYLSTMFTSKYVQNFEKN